MIRFTVILCMTAIACAGDGLVWKQLPSLPDPPGVAGSFAGVSGISLIVAGGANFPDKMPWEGGKKVWHDRVWVLDKPDGTWREGSKLPRPLGYGVSVSAPDGPSELPLVQPARTARSIALPRIGGAHVGLRDRLSAHFILRRDVVRQTAPVVSTRPRLRRCVHARRRSSES